MCSVEKKGAEAADVRFVQQGACALEGFVQDVYAVVESHSKNL